jgi:hypothetical protein
MDAKQLFKQAKGKADQLPSIVKTPVLIQAVMLAEIAQWIDSQHFDFDAMAPNAELALSIFKTSRDAIDMIRDYMRYEIL